MTDRKIICKIITGSHLYGTSRPESDTDYTGVFLHNKEDLENLMTGIQSPPSEMSESVKITEGSRNGKGDIDCRFWSVQKFFKLAGEGQPGALELLFAPESCIVEQTDEWREIVANRDIFLSRKQSYPFIGFATAQAWKSSVKAENLILLRMIAAWGALLTDAEKQNPIITYLVPVSPDGEDVRFNGPERIRKDSFFNSFNFWGHLFKIQPNDRKWKTLRVAGRQYDPTLKTKTFLENIETLVSKYGSRSAAAAADGLDFKSLMHAERLLNQIEELIVHGHITLPRPPEEAARLLKIRSGEVDKEIDWHSNILDRCDTLRDTLLPVSKLPDTPDWLAIRALCLKILKKVME